jgi:hypothetical protein
MKLCNVLVASPRSWLTGSRAQRSIARETQEGCGRLRTSSASWSLGHCHAPQMPRDACQAQISEGQLKQDVLYIRRRMRSILPPARCPQACASSIDHLLIYLQLCAAPTFSCHPSVSAQPENDDMTEDWDFELSRAVAGQQLLMTEIGGMPPHSRAKGWRVPSPRKRRRR